METVLIFAPLVGAVLCGLGWRLVGELAATSIAAAMMGLAAVLALLQLLTFNAAESDVVLPLLRWLESGSLSVDWVIRVDLLAASVAMLATGLAALVFLHGFAQPVDPDNLATGTRARGYAMLSLLVFGALVMVVADNLVQFFVGWQLIAVASCLGIGLRHQTRAPNRAGIFALVSNGISDTAILVALTVLFMVTDTLSFDQLSDPVALADVTSARVSVLGIDMAALTLIAALLVVGVLGRSGGLIFQTWVTGAAEAPARVLALVAAVTLSSAVILVLRISPLVDTPTIGAAIATAGTISAILAMGMAAALPPGREANLCFSGGLISLTLVAVGIGAGSAALPFLMVHGVLAAVLILSGRGAADWAGRASAALLVISTAVLGMHLLSTAADPLSNALALGAMLAVGLTAIAGGRAFFVPAGPDPLPALPATLADLALLAIGAALTIVWALGIWALFFAVDIAIMTPRAIALPLVAMTIGIALGFWLRRKEVPDSGWVGFISGGFGFNQVVAGLIVTPIFALSGILSRGMDLFWIDRMAGRLTPWFANADGKARRLPRAAVFLAVYACAVAAVVWLVANLGGAS
ncbi:MAG: proton-conducting transporter membrane subunit [Pseudomonadota bacterium]